MICAWTSVLLWRTVPNFPCLTFGGHSTLLAANFAGKLQISGLIRRLPTLIRAAIPLHCAQFPALRGRELIWAGQGNFCERAGNWLAAQATPSLDNVNQPP